MIARGEIAADPAIDEAQMQPASIDLRLGTVAYRVPASFLPGRWRRWPTNWPACRCMKST